MRMSIRRPASIAIPSGLKGDSPPGYFIGIHELFHFEDFG